MKCVKCGTENANESGFCMNCGAPLAAPAAQLPPQPAPQPAYPPQQPQPAYPAPQPQPVYPAPQPQPVYPAQPQQGYPPQGGYYPGQQAYGRSGMSAINIWGPFAGYGTRRRHIGWLMDNRGPSTPDLIKMIGLKFQERQIPEAFVNPVTLTGRGVLVENRPYFLIRRGLVTMGLHIGQFGRDLFISLVSYLKPPLSTFRMILLGAMVVFWLFMNFVFQSLLSGASDSSLLGLLYGGSSGDGIGGLVTLLCVVAPLGVANNIALFLFVLYSLYKFITEKDILAGLRVQPNEFNQDDLMSLEKAVEQTVRISLDEIGLDPADLKPVFSDSDRRLI